LSFASLRTHLEKLSQNTGLPFCIYTTGIGNFYLGWRFKYPEQFALAGGPSFCDIWSYTIFLGPEKV